MPAGAVVPSVPVPVPAASHSHIHHQATPPSSSLSSTAHLNPSEAGPEASTGSSPLITRAVVANDTDVSNGFVKDGKTLPYVFEANDAGFRKRSSKILPECAICGKKFVCVTTMKRHLVTHTGERPFNCKICGKQYTQKGNLRVHERTHRNDRPFECNICHQNFFRKEPMQKHQWRQHGIGHYKSRPHGPDGTSIGIIGAETILYNSLIDRIKTEPRTSEDHDPPPAPALPEPAPGPEPEVDGEAEDLSEAEDEDSSGPFTRPDTLQPVQDAAEDTDHDDPRLALDMLTRTEAETADQPRLELEDSQDSGRPIKLKLKLAQAYLREGKEEREREERDQRAGEGRDTGTQHSTVGSLEQDLGTIQLSRPGPGGQGEYVECVCKACGSQCSVTDPYNFSCPVCSVKYTSLPTHMIADPLQCIGCLKVFEHKPAMKEHQSSADKDRPFVCCKCGYEFKQKAHLQKHQWRIYRRKLEPDPNVKEAEAILKAVNELPGPVEAAAPAPAAPRAAPLDLSPCKMYGSSSSITAWVQQVEVARAPPTPDISILQLPQLFAVKSKPPVYLPASVPSAREDNPLLNQKPVSLEELASLAPVPGPAYTDRVYKRARKEPEEEQSQPADLSINPRLDFSRPAPAPALSPPLNLSSKMSDCVPHDYTISRSELISGQLRRLRNQDERSGI